MVKVIEEIKIQNKSVTLKYKDNINIQDYSKHLELSEKHTEPGLLEEIVLINDQFLEVVTLYSLLNLYHSITFSYNKNEIILKFDKENEGKEFLDIIDENKSKNKDEFILLEYS